jgi:hypothetical protein
MAIVQLLQSFHEDNECHNLQSECHLKVFILIDVDRNLEGV